MRSMAIGVIAGGEDPLHSLRRVQHLGLECCQLLMPGPEWFEGDRLADIQRQSEESEVEIVGFFCHFAGESYADIPTIHRTVGLVNPETRSQRVQQVLQNSDDVAKLGTPALLAHIGFMPEDRNSEAYRQLVIVMQQICDQCARHSQNFGLETGQETAPQLKQFIHDVGRPNVKVNFDPANMLLYGSGRPLESLELVKEYVASVHCKDGRWPAQPGQLGEEVPFGEGEVNAPAFIGRLKEIGFTGPLIIEREIAGEEQQRDIIRARDLIAGLR